MKRLYPFLIGILFLFAHADTLASHTAGAKLTYVEVNPGTYFVNLAILRDCNGITLGNTVFMDINGPCGSSSATLPLAYSVFTSNTCNPAVFPSTCNGGNQPGYELLLYSDTISLQQGPTCSWTLSWDLCCRNNSIVNLATPSSESLYVEAKIEAGTFGVNSSPDFLNAAVPVFCAGNPVVYDPVVIDLEGDSLVFELIDALDFGAVPVPYGPGFTGMQPMAGMTINPATGVLNFTPMMLGNFVVVTRVHEYRGGQYMGSVMFDTQFIVASCSNSNPFPVSIGMQNFSGDAVPTGPYSIAMCEGQNFCFDVSFDDADAGQSLSISSDVTTNLPGATLTTSGTSPITATVCWTAPAGAAGVYPIIITAGDSVCPLQGQTTLAVLVAVTPGTFAGPDVTVCNGTGATIGVFGFAPYQWSVLSGDPIVLGSNFTCDTCLNPIANPASTTTYLLTSNAPTGCVLTDTVVVNVVPNLTSVASPADTTICLNESVMLNAVASPFDPTFTYSWTPTTGLNNPSSPNPILTSNNQGANVYYVTIGNSTGCVIQDSVVVNITSTPTFDIGLDSVGLSDPPIALNGMPAGGSYLGIGLSGNTFVPGAAGVGNWILVYQGTGGCAGSAFDTIVVYQDVGLIEHDLNNGGLTLLPNPAEDYFSISNMSGFVSLEMFDAQGRMVKTWNENAVRFELDGIRPGMYQVILRSADGTSRSSLLVE